MSAVWISSAQECTQSVHLTSVSCDSIVRPTGVISCHVDLIPIMVLILHWNSNVLLPYVRIFRSYHFVHIFCVSYLYVLMHILCVCIFYHFNERPLSTVLYALFLCLWWKVSNDLNKRLKLGLLVHTAKLWNHIMKKVNLIQGGREWRTNESGKLRQFVYHLIIHDLTMKLFCN